MNKLNQTIAAITVLFVSTSVSASNTGSKIAERTATHINFNKMIDDSGAEKTQVENKVNDRLDRAQMQSPRQANTERKASDRSKVINFVDVEVGVGKERPIVDRRFNSDGDPVVVQIGS
jgi:phosphoribulokinase